MLYEIIDVENQPYKQWKPRKVETSESTELNFINVFKEAYQSRERIKTKFRVQHNSKALILERKSFFVLPLRY